MEKLFGIMRRAYYGCFGLLFVGSSISLCYFYLFTNRSDPDWARIAFTCIAFLPIAFVIHRAIHWVIWGKLK